MLIIIFFLTMTNCKKKKYQTKERYEFIYIKKKRKEI